MNIKIREYELEDASKVAVLLEFYEDSLTPSDPCARIGRRESNFGEKYLEATLEYIRKYNGKFYLATDEEDIVGFLVSIINKPLSQTVLEEGKRKVGRIVELFVKEEYRNKGVGKILMKTVEDEFIQIGCDGIDLVVYSLNPAIELYKAAGFKERSINMLKELKK